MTVVKSAGAPSSPRLTFHVGVVGHRPNRLKGADLPALAARLYEALASVKAAVIDYSATHPGLYPDQPPGLRAVSPLAEGTDRYFVREALRLGYELCCPLPFPKGEFENDFKPGQSLETGLNSVAEFNHLLDQARKETGLRVIELDGQRTDSAGAYAAAGEVVLDKSDLLIVVWDGGGENKRGGTRETLEKALASHVPVLWIDARAPHPWQLLDRESDLSATSRARHAPTRHEALDLTAIVKDILDRPLGART